MKIIHTSDWHLGQNFMGKSRAAEHRAFLHWLLEQIDKHQVDALIVAGDIFDTGAPPSYARELYNRFVVEIQPYDCQLVILGGNHDSAATLNESRELLACLNTHVIPAVMPDIEQQIILLYNRKQEPGALLCAIPFIRPRDVLQSQAGQSGREKQHALQQAIADHYAAVYQQALARRKKLPKRHRQIPVIATGHLTTVGASTSDSVREIYIGTLDAFPASAFPPADYIALGHIHQSQQVANSEHIRYSGSPIPLSFDESGKQQAKSVLLVDFDTPAAPRIQPLTVPEFQALRVIKGDLEQIEQALQAYSTAPQADNNPVWLEVIVSTQDYLEDLQQRIEQQVADLPVDVLRVRRERKARHQALDKLHTETLHELDVHEVFERRLQQENMASESEIARAARLKQRFREVVAHLENPAQEETPEP